MRKLTAIAICFIAFSCHKSSLPQDFYYGVIADGENRYRFGLDNRKTKPSLTIISFRGYGGPLKRYSFQKDSVFFSRVDPNGYYKGRFDQGRNQIIGEWTSEDTLKFALNLSPANPDTIKRLNPRTTSTYQYKSPELESDSIKVCTIKDVDINESKINALIRALMQKRFGYVHSVLIARNNCLAVEEYFFEYNRDEHFGIQSVTKSFVSALAGIAISKSEISGTDAPLCNYQAEFNELVCNAQNRNITLHDVMNMSTGLAWDEVTYAYGHEKNSSMIASETNDPLRYLFSQPRSSSKTFAYNSYNHTAMSHVLKKATGLTNAEEYEQRIIKPLGITQYDLGEADNGIIGDIFLRPRDMLKFGSMYLNEGKHNGKQLVPASWVKESTSSKIQIENDLGYGYFWWTKNFKHKDRKVSSYFAWGYGGQFIFVIPELKLVVVLNGTNWSTDPKRYYFEMMEDFILPAIE
jgi:CubicO group peptidase (beta-lactamase class C family)